MINNTITIHDNQAFESMRKSGKLAAEILDFITPHIVPGITTERIDKLCYDYHIANNAIPGPLGYRGFPKSICTSINHVVCHGIPGDRILKDGDIINIDVSPILDGWYGDTSRMFFVGNVKIKGQRLVNITYEAMFEGIKAVRPGATLGDIGYSIQNFVENQGFSVVRDFCGHGIGQTFHCPPNVMHYGNKGEGLVLKEGMIFTFAPRTFFLGSMHTIGRLFPRGDRAPSIEPIAEKKLWNLLDEDGRLSQWSRGRAERVKSGFYISQACELVRC